MINATQFTAGATIPLALQLADTYGNVLPEIVNNESVVVHLEQLENTNIAGNTQPDSSSLPLAFSATAAGSAAVFGADAEHGFLASWSRSLRQAGVYKLTVALDKFPVLQVRLLYSPEETLLRKGTLPGDSSGDCCW